jgi:zinc protease
MHFQRLASFMRSLLSSLLIACLSASSAVASTPASPSSLTSERVPIVTDTSERVPIVTTTLANGLRVVILEDHATPVVQTSLWYRFGAKNETAGRTGLAHGLEHMMFRGTPSISSSGLDEIAARLGGELNANTANDYTHFYLVMPADRLELALRIEADRMRNLTLSENDWKLEKGAVLSEYDGDLSQPITKLYDAVCRAASSARLCSLAALGEREDIVRSRATDLRGYYNTYYAPNNATLVITGDVNTAQAFSLAEQSFGSLAAKKLPLVNASAIVYAKKKTVAVSADYPFQVVDIAYPVPGSQDPEYAPLQIADAIITNQRSMFYQNLVVSGLTLGYQTSYDDNIHGGIYHVFLIVNPEHTSNQARTAFEDTLEQTERSGFPASLAKAAKISVTSNAVYARDSITGLGDRVGYALGVEGISDPALDDQKVQNATLDDVNTAARHFLATPAVVGTLTPTSRKPGDARAPSSTGVSDSFGNRTPNGSIVLTPWARKAIRRPITLRSTIDPVRFTLSNGIHVLVQEVHTNPTVFVSGRIESSPRFDPAKKEGVGMLTTALLSYGSEKYDFNAQRRIADDLGASIEFGENFGAHGMAKDLKVLLGVIADAEQHPVFPTQYVELVRRQTLAGIAQRDHDPDYLASRAFQRLLLPAKDPTLRETNKASVSSITIADLRRYAAAYLRPDLTTISVVGDVTPSDIRTQLEAAFGTWSAHGPTPDVSEQPIPAPTSASTYITTARDEVSVRIGQPAPSRRSGDFPALNLMNMILGGGGGFDTRLMSEIRVKRGLVYTVSSTLNVDRYRGTLDFTLHANPKNVAAAVSVLKKQLTRMQQEPVTKDELSRAKSKIIAGSLISEQATDTILAHVENIGISDLPSDYYQTLDTRYGSLTQSDIQRVARTYLLPNHLVEVFEGPHT